MRGRLRLGIAIAAMACLSVVAPAASGAVYEVHACRLPNGDPAPALGWKATAGSVASLNCPGGRMAVRAPVGTTAFGDGYGLTFQAPSGTTLVRLSRRAEGQLVSSAAFTWGLHLLLKCGDGPSGGPCRQTDSYFGIPQVAVKIDDSAPPRVVSASGSLLASNGPLKGERHLAMKLSDVGSGLLRVAVDLSWRRSRAS